MPDTKARRTELERDAADEARAAGTLENLIGADGPWCDICMGAHESKDHTEQNAQPRKPTISAVIQRDDAIQRARMAKARKIAAWLHREFVKTAQNCTPEMRQNAAAQADCNADKPPSTETWEMVMSILKGPKV